MNTVELYHNEAWRPAKCFPGKLTRLRKKHEKASHYFTQAGAEAARANAGKTYADGKGTLHPLKPAMLRVMACECSPHSLELAALGG